MVGRLTSNGCAVGRKFKEYYERFKNGYTFA